MTALAKKRPLGRGLSSLLGDAPKLQEVISTSPDSVLTLPIHALKPGIYQTRETFDEEELNNLSRSIAENGILLPILVRKKDEAYEIIAGERRWRAAKKAELQNVPVIIKELDDQKALEIGLIENVQRADLNPIEESIGYQRLIQEFAYTHEDIARSVGKSRSHITNILRLLELEAPIKSLISNQTLTFGHGKALLQMSKDQRLSLIDKIVEQKLSVRETEKLAREVFQKTLPRGDNENRERTPTFRDPDIEIIEAQIEAVVGIPTKIKLRGNGGSVIIDFKNYEQLDILMNSLMTAKGFSQ